VGDAVGLQDYAGQHSGAECPSPLRDAVVAPPAALDLFVDNHIFWGD
jgi:hypothetical protein